MSRFPTCSSYPLAARDALDLGPHQALDHARQIVVEPGLEHRPQHFAHQILERAAVLHQHRLRERVEGGIDGRGGRGRDQAALAALERHPAAAPVPHAAGPAIRRLRLTFHRQHVRLRLDGAKAGESRHGACSGAATSSVGSRTSEAGSSIDAAAGRVDVACNWASISSISPALQARARTPAAREAPAAATASPVSAVAICSFDGAQRAAFPQWAHIGRVLGWIFFRNDPADGGENFLHRGFLTLRWLRH